MGIKSFLGIESSDTASLKSDLANATFTIERLVESSQGTALSSLSREDAGWERINAQYEREFTREALRTNCIHGRVFAVGNPMIKRALNIRTVYVHGQGVGTVARGDGTDGTQDVNAIVQKWLDDQDTRAVFSGAQAQERNELSLGTDGNMMFALVTNPLTGSVTPRIIDFDEIVDKYCVPGDRVKTMYYLRRWSEIEMITNREVQHVAYYPDLNYKPLIRERFIGGIEVKWDQPIYHVSVNGLNGWKWGIGDVYPVLPWVRSYKEFLENWAKLMDSLTTIAWRLSSSNTKDSQKKRAAIEDFTKLPAGSTFMGSDNNKLEAMPKTGATIDANSAKPLAAMVAAGLGVSVTTLLSDPGQEGARAVAETLNLPTRLEMQARQEVWREARRQIIGYVIEQNVMAPRGELKGKIFREDSKIWAELTEPEDGTLDITYPPLDEIPVDTIVKAITAADATGTLDPLLVAEQLMRALRIRDVDEWLDKAKDADGNWKDPRGESDAAAGNAATQAARNGENPAEVI